MLKLPKYLAIETKFAELCYKIQDNKLSIDLSSCRKYIAQLTKEIEELDILILPNIPMVNKKKTPLINIYKKDGSYNCHAINWINTGNPYEIIGNTMERWERKPINLGHPASLIAYLKSLGWVPREDPDRWNYKLIRTKYGKFVKLKDSNGNYIRTSPKLPKEDWELDQLSKISSQFRLIAERMKRRHRLGAIQGYVKNTNKDSKIPMVINPCGCNTMRVKHKIVCNIPRVGSYFGQEMRSLFTASPGNVMVSTDINGLEACMLAHLLGDKEFIEFIVKNDFKYHKFFHNVIKDYVSSYDQCKSINFAYLYGAGDEKLGSLCDLKPGRNKIVGAELRATLEKYVPNLKNSIDKLKLQIRKYKGIIGLDGRLIPVRKDFAALNTYCQGNGAICSKVWTCNYRHNIKKQKLDSKHVIFYHDSNTEDCKKDIALPVKKIMLDSLDWTTEYLHLKIQLTGSTSISYNWSEGH